MPRTQSKINVYLELGTKRVIAGALDWPGWCRVGRDELSALELLADYAPRYGRVMNGTRLGFQEPSDATAFAVVERLKGSGSTDFGVPGLAPSSDLAPASDADLKRFQTLLMACWRAFDGAVKSAQGKQLRLGPRGGGRDLGRIVEHVLDAEAIAYLGALGVKFKADPESTVQQQLEQTHQAVLAGLTASAHGELPKCGPRGGLRWTPRYMVRRVAYHVLDHTWEIEDRVT